MNNNRYFICDLLAQTPHLFGVIPQNSILLYFMEDTGGEKFILGPTIRLDFPEQDSKSRLPYSVDNALEKLSVTGCNVVLALIVREGWHQPSTYRTIEFIEQNLDFLIESRGYVFYDMMLVEKLVEHSTWISMRSGIQGTVSQAVISPLNEGG